MDENTARSIIKVLELQNQVKNEDLSIAKQRISDLEKQVEDLSGNDPTYVGNESQIDFIRKIADSSSKFAKEAKDIIASIEGS